MAYTSADERRDLAKRYVDDAIEDLAAVVIHRISGWDEYTEDYRNRLKMALDRLLEARELLE